MGSLDPAQRDILAPLQENGTRLPPRKQAIMLKRAEVWTLQPPQSAKKSASALPAGSC
jgi:hypothetical protein